MRDELRTLHVVECVGITLTDKPCTEQADTDHLVLRTRFQAAKGTPWFER
ncbi:hypothetical protein Hesp01_50890 [Herbidospora sp. NBRC 101105]|nr:hypothetical protein Hesp01_50890 [Herbidospora sp. NBRC 101105]